MIFRQYPLMPAQRHLVSLARLSACCAAFVAVLYGYMVLMEGLHGFHASRAADQLIELALVVYFYSLFYIIQKPSMWRGVLAGVPILLFYAVHDIFYLAYGKVFRLINIAELPELLQVLPLGYALLAAMILLLPLAALAYAANYRRPASSILWLSPLAALVIFVYAIPNAFARNFQQLATEIVTYSDGKSVEANGRIAMMLYHEAQRIDALDRLAPYRNRQDYDRQQVRLGDEIGPHANRRNVHLIVLESFLDPRLFRKLRFSSSPVHPDFEQMFGDQLGLSISPMFGGSTAQAEFEILCGVPAFEKLSSVEFNVFTGSAAHCLPSQLEQLGYRSVASNAYKPNFFNAQPGYKGAGFSESYFPQEFSGTRQSYLSFGDPGEEEYLYDGELFSQNLAFVKSHLQQRTDQPLLNYVMTIYGHTPHLLDTKKRPPHIKLESDYHDDHLERAVNQFYYRTGEIARYARQLLAQDSNSLIIFISDHVPPLRNGLNTYDELAYMDNGEQHYYYNRIAILENGKPRVLPPIRHFDLPAYVLDYVSDGAYCQRNTCAFADGAKRPGRDEYLDAYMALMAHASE